ncbi:anoctamin-10 isoform X3 [Eurytemora carolleeae]|uniref:anoctamin-10 isoform X3 n=1 Tax=Eurytemora carolleeae TaxID=1294199 RepID=UPI000C75AF2D|nr:anoctamin-10 isoform X3 [Eurytemora carolleeae]|eukprot:XP_023323846.1 anoctamin-10-like isoform X3 [Eurytemora affinis]
MREFKILTLILTRRFRCYRVHFGVDIIKLPGHGSSVMKRAPVVSSYEEKHLLTLIPTHDHETIDTLYKNWKRTYFSSPVDQIRDYFGEGVSLYFSFSSLYTRFLIIIALLGITEFLSEKYLGMDHVYSSVGFTLLNIFGLALYLEVWKRTSNEQSYFWGTTGKLRNKIPRPEYRGDLRMSPISGKEEMYYSPSKTMKKVLMVSAPLTLLCLSIALMLMFASLYVEAELIVYLTDPETGEIYPDIFSSVLSNIPSITYSLLIILFNSIYLKIARKLTIWENHRTQEQHDTHVTAKLVVFEFVNTFIALFYTGFYLQDLKSLKSQLFTTLMVQQAVNQVQEVLIPFFLHKPSSVRLMSKVSAKLGIKQKIIERNVKNIEELSSEDPRIQPVLQDIGADHLDSLHDDFMELWLQFGHVFLFSAVYPLAAVLALSNNITELWADRYKMCRLTRKPRPVSVRDIGAWYTAFKLIGMLSVLTNCCLLSLDLKSRTEVSWFSSDLSWFLFWVLVEHILLCIFLGLDTLISDVPRHVKMEQDRTEHHFKQLSIKQKQE